MAAFQISILYNIVRLFWHFRRTSTLHPVKTQEMTINWTIPTVK